MITIPASIFRAYDVRGVVGETLTPEIAQLLGRAFGSEVRARDFPEVVVGRDARPSSHALVAALTDGLRQSRLDVIDLGEVPTPVLSFALEHLGTGTGVMVTGSHNPPEYNGFKFTLAGRALHGEGIQHLRARISEQYFVAGRGRLRHAEIIPAYIERIARDLRLARRLKVALDCGNGIAGAVAPAVLRRLGCEVVECYCEVDGRFPHHHPDPSRPENLVDLIDTVRREGCDIGLALDGDGDRLGVVDEQGSVVWPDRLLMRLAIDLLARRPGAVIIHDIKCSRHLPAVIRAHGGEPVMCRSGHSFLRARLMEDPRALLAGELSGHLFFRDGWYGFDDAIYAGARLLGVLAATDGAASGLFDELPASLATPELQIRFAREGAQHAFMRRLCEDVAFPGARVTLVDGIRADFPWGFGLVRASNTTPALTLRFEADDAERLAEIQALFRAKLLALDPTLALPF
ncbi:MAG TPA: phosphomannomutase/phosphoglucomutase [Thioalkalivibrio sp.]|nr:phosphomannomutase/phosphoglucomutase [Thioalkalivibrio sp.]